ncbi:hypothetical protein [Histidinibacterium aquaticum]|uniref:Uncharacterized protein n=1 Tax=Histidinibacterium aquaticum TaxID=2613962 RepID=A0A5J5GN79_9RHOB|nr:hypothetical protein [Histidinibacterium aquaticum]KAA9009801.1 hypothetical protein F3S47_00590 [Histidinibacterium aquaticum]
MPLDRFVLILVAVVAAAGATVVIATLLLGTWLSPGLGLAAAIPVLLVAYVLWRVISHRIAEAPDDRYDGIDN